MDKTKEVADSVDDEKDKNNNDEAEQQIEPSEDNKPDEDEEDKKDDKGDVDEQKEQEQGPTVWSNGLIFFYWPYYKNLNNIKSLPAPSWNLNNYGGYSIFELYVNTKYSNFKEELLSNAHINIEQYNQMISKVQALLNTDYAKKIKSADDGDELHCGIQRGSALMMNHLLALKIFSDFTNFSNDFISTFSGIKPKESLDCIKKRHMNYWWMSKYMREAVQCYGNNEEKGPFYVGISQIQMIPSFAVRLNKPVFASKEIKIAMLEAGKNGMIMELQNDGVGKYERFFDVSWLSDFADEQKRIFMGGYTRIRVQSIRLIETKQNFATFCKAFYLFDCMVSGSTYFSKIKCESKDVEIILKCVTNELGQSQHKFDEYIKKTFTEFCQRKQCIVINLDDLYEFDRKLVELILYGVQKKNKSDSNPINIVKASLFKLFPNADLLYIYSNKCAFSLPYFMKIISESKSLKNIMIKAENDGYDDYDDYGGGGKQSWIMKEYSDNYQQLNGAFSISFKKMKAEYGMADCVQFDRK